MNSVLTNSIRFLVSLAACLLLFSLLPLVHFLVGGPQVQEKVLRTASAVEIIQEKKQQKPRVQEKQIRKVSSSRSRGPSNRSLDLKFSPDLSVGSGSGVGVQQENLENMVFEEGEVDEKARPRYRTGISFPPAAQEMGLSGVVAFVIVVDRKGRVADVQFEEVPHSIFKKPIERAVRKWRFDPAKKNGVPVSQKFRQRIEFNLAR
jgi:TonB family protein